MKIVRYLILVGLIVFATCFTYGRAQNNKGVATTKKITAKEMYRRSVVVGKKRMKVKQAIPLWTKKLKDLDYNKRLDAASNLFQAAGAKQMTYTKEISKTIVTAYKKEKKVEIKFALLAILAEHSDPQLDKLLEQASKDADPLVRNLVNLIRNKEYLKPAVIENP